MKEFIYHLFVPRQSNNHRSRLLHYEVLLLVIAVLVSGLITMAGVQREYPAVLGISANISVSDLLNYTNQKRQENGLATLKLNSKLSSAAEHKAKNMFANNYWAHVAPDGTTPWVFIKDSGYQYLYAGENLARGFTTGQDVVNAWMASPSHKENLLSPNYSDIGFAIDTGTLTGSDTVLVVQMFGSPYSPKDNINSESTEPKPGGIISQLSPEPSSNPKPTETIVSSNQQKNSSDNIGVASIQNKPLFDSNILKRNSSFLILMMFIFVLLLDAIIIERNKLIRAFSHNIDHVLFLLFVLIAGIIIGRGVIL